MPKVFLAIVVVGATALVLGISNLGLRSYNLVADASGEPKLLSYPRDPCRLLVGLPRCRRFSWAKPLFGDTSTWNRYILHATSGGDIAHGRSGGCRRD